MVSPRWAVTLLALASFGCAQMQGLFEERNLPESFAASSTDEQLSSELDLVALWSTPYPSYDGEVRVLVSSTPVEGLSPNYNAAFYRRLGDRFVRIGTGCGFGGYHPPTLGQHPTLDIPAIVAVMDSIPERTYFFLQDETCQSLQEDDDSWIPVEELR